jgi:CSLREA domain-containing protein
MPRSHLVAQCPSSRSVLALALTLLAPASADAATLPVTTAVDIDLADADCSLREAIVAANTDAAYNGCPAGSGADRIVFALTLPATIALASDLPTITATLAIVGPGATDLALDGQDLYDLLVLDSAAGGEWLGVEELTLTRGLATEHGGGALIKAGDIAYFRQVVFLDNRSSNGGGGLAVSGNSGTTTTVGVEECWFSGNRALGASGGGGLLTVGPNVAATIDRTTFSGNRADAASGSGGGLVVNRSTVSLRRSTVSGNFANGSGAGIYLLASTSPASLTIHDSTITANQADADASGAGDGGGLHTSINAGQTCTLELANTILAGNLDAGVQIYPDVSVFSGLTLVSLGFNLIGSNAGGTAFFLAGLPNGDGDWIGTAAAPIDPLLDALADHGGFAPTHRPTADPATPVIDQGFCTGSGSDQRGYGDAAAHVRIVDTIAPNGAGSDGCDIGAHERGGDPEADPTLFEDDFEAGHALYWSSQLP